MLDIIESLFKLIFELITEIFKVIFNVAPDKKTKLDAGFMKVSKLLSSWNKGFCLNGTKHIGIKASHTSCLVLGGSGSGKTVSVCIPTIYNLAKHGHSITVHDPSSELYNNVSGYLEYLGYSIKVVNYSNPNISDGFNPMYRLKNSASETQKLASLLVRNSMGENNKDPFWQTQASLLIYLIMRVLQHKSHWYQNLANVKRVLDNMTTKPEAMDILVAECRDESILSEYKNFLILDKKLYTSIISSARAALSIFTDPLVQTVTAYDSIDFDSFRKEKTALFINNKTGDIKYYSALSSVFFEQFFSSIMDKLPSKEDKNIFFIIDESSSLYLPSMQIALSNLRKYKAGIMNIAQDFNQFHIYGSQEAEAIRTNSFAKIYFPGQPLNTAQELEKLLGSFEFEDEKGNRRTRPLMTIDEIRAMEPNTALIVAGSNRAVFTKMKPYFKSYKYKNLSKYALPERQSQIPFEELPLIPLPNKIK